MCGFVGIVLPNKADRSKLQSMSELISYRGPDKFNFLDQEKFSFYHNRLTIISSDGGAQPVFCEKSKNCMVYNGEIYNFRELSKKIPNKNDLNKDSDTSVIFHLINQLGIERALSYLNGMYSIVFFDYRNSKIYLARDKFGQKPLYYKIFNQKLYFGSEIKSLLKNSDISNNSSINISGVSNYLFFDSIPGIETQYKNIYKILPGELKIFNLSDHGIEIDRSINIQDLKSSNKLDLNPHDSEKKILETLDRILNESVKRHLISDHPVAGLLSGGLDSSLICSIASKYNKIETYTVSFEERSHDEIEYAKKISEINGLKNNKIFLKNEELKDIAIELFEKIDEPINDPSFIPTYFLFKEVSKNYKVALGGDGADEIFYGYKNFEVLKYSKIIKTKLFKVLCGTLTKLPNFFFDNEKYMSFPFLINQLYKGSGNKEELQSYYFMSSFNMSEISKITSKEFSEESLNIKQSSKKILDHNFDEIQLQKQFFENYLPNIILQKLDRSSMYNSVESRSPFLDDNFSDASIFYLNNNKKYRKSKNLLKKIAEKYLPKSIINRKKHGFTPPLYQLVNHDLKDYINDIVRSKTHPLYSYLNYDQVIKILDDHYIRGIDSRKKISSLLNLFASI